MAVHRTISIAGDLNTSIRMTRGLRQLTEGVSWAPWELSARVLTQLGYLPVRAGEETILDFGAARIPQHAEIGKITATLELGPSAATSPAKMEQGAQVREGNTTRSFTTSLDPPSGPSSLTLGIEGGDVIWTWSGRPGPTSFDIPDFSEQANGFLERSVAEGENGEDGLVSLRMTLRSDLDAGVRLTLPPSGLEYRLVQPQGWDNDLDGTIHMDRNLELAFGQILEVPLDPIVEGAGDRTVPVEELRLDVGGELGLERLLGEIVPPVAKEYATVGRGFAVAQQVSLPEALPSAQCVGVALALATEGEAEIYFEIQPDASGSPASETPLASGTALVSPADQAKSPRWVTGRFTEPATLSADAAPYWLVLKEIRGVLRVGLNGADSGYLGALLTNRGGQFWQGLLRRDAGAAPARRALARLVYLPEVDTRSAAVELVAELIGPAGTPSHTATAKIDPTPEAQLVQLRFPAGARARRIRLSARSHAQGGLSLANLVQVYRPS